MMVTLFNPAPQCPKCTNSGPMMKPGVDPVACAATLEFGFDARYYEPQTKTQLDGTVDVVGPERMVVTCRVCSFAFLMLAADTRPSEAGGASA